MGEFIRLFCLFNRNFSTALLSFSLFLTLLPPFLMPESEYGLYGICGIVEEALVWGTQLERNSQIKYRGTSATLCVPAWVVIGRALVNTGLHFYCGR